VVGVIGCVISNTKRHGWFGQAFGESPSEDEDAKAAVSILSPPATTRSVVTLASPALTRADSGRIHL
jgi:hypothetical protein